MIYINGGKYEFVDFRNEYKNYHRLNNPAYICGDYHEWWINGKLHRLDGPAIIFHNGDKIWYINDKKYTETEYNKKIREMKSL